MNVRSFAAPCTVALVVVAGLAVAHDAPADPTTTIAVNVGTFRNRTGFLGCRLFRSPDGFPESSANTIEKRVAITGGVTSCSFDDVAPGTYAISVMHDENGNRKLDKNFFGVPTEGYGVSNNHTYAMSNPTWDESKFVVEPGKRVALAIALRY